MNLAESTYYRDPKVTRKERDEMDADVRGKVEQIESSSLPLFQERCRAS